MIYSTITSKVLSQSSATLVLPRQSPLIILDQARQQETVDHDLQRVRSVEDKDPTPRRIKSRRSRLRFTVYVDVLPRDRGKHAGG